MNIAIDIRPLMSPHRTGVGEYTYELLNSLFKIDHQNQYFLFYNSYSNISQNIPQWKYDNVHYIHTRWPNKLFNLCQKFFKYPKIDRLITKQINTHTLQQLDYFFSPNLNFTSLSKNIKYILTIHDLSFEFYPQYYSLKRRIWHWTIKAKKQCQQANLILTPSKNTAQDLIKYFKIKPNKIKVIYPGLSSNFSKISKEQVTNNKIKKKYGLPDNFILYLGTIEPRKNITGIIEAFEKIKNQSPISSVQYLIIAGTKGWKNNKIYKKAKQSKYRNSIKFIGYIEPNDKPIVYHLAKIFIYPSFYEGFGFPVLEAMACEVPVITSNRSSLPEITNNSVYLINPNKIDEISLAIKNLIANKELNRYYIKKGIEQIKKFNWKNTAKEFLNQL